MWQPFLFLLFLVEGTVNVKRMIMRSEPVKFACSLYYLAHPWIAELNYLPCFNIYKVVVLPALVSPFKLGNVFSELVLYNQVAVEQYLDGVVQRSPAYPVILILHENIQRLNVEMTSPGIYLIQYSVSLGGLPVTFPFKILCEYLLHS